MLMQHLDQPQRLAKAQLDSLQMERLDLLVHIKNPGTLF